MHYIYNSHIILSNVLKKGFNMSTKLFPNRNVSCMCIRLKDTEGLALYFLSHITAVYHYITG